MDKPVSADKSWVADLEHVMRYGNPVSPRGMAVREVIAFMSVISMSDPIIHNPKRELGYKFMAAEAAWILSGDDRVETIAPYSKEISKFSDNGEIFFGAYGPKIVRQLDYVVQTLLKDVDTRQAVLTIWRENPPQSKDIPCTVSMQWLVRNGQLNCIVNMRSSDLWLGHPYDIFNFSAVSFAILLTLNNLRYRKNEVPIQLGNLYLNAGSKHIYERNFERVDEILAQARVEERSHKPVFVLEDYYTANDFVGALWDAAQSSDGAKTLIGE